MLLTRLSLLTLAAASAVAGNASADGREPGSLLVFPLQQSALQGPTVFDVVSVTNTNRAGDATTDVHFEYVDVSASPTPFLFANCAISDRIETLTPADTLSVLTSCHDGATSARGYLVVTARDPDLVDTPWSFDHLIGSQQVVTIGGGMYSLNAIPFTSPRPERANTDVSPNDGRRDFDGVEYEPLPDELYVDSFIGALSGHIALVGLTGPEYLTNVDFIVYNDDEFQLSGQYSFACWAHVPLADVSGYFTAQGLATTSDDPAELDITCDGQQEFDTGWAIVRPKNALSITSAPITNPAVLGALTHDGGPFNSGRLLWESAAKQTNGAFASSGVPSPLIDPAFDVGAGFDDLVFAIAPALDGSGAVYFGGSFTSYDGHAANRIVRLAADGSIDADFISGAGFDDRVTAIAPALDGSGDVYVGGHFISYDGTASRRIVRLNSDGSIDSGFDVGSGFDGRVLAIAPATDGSGAVYAGGVFVSYDGTPSRFIIRLAADGSVDSSFDVGTGFSGIVVAIAPATDASGDVHVGGGFTSYDGTGSQFLIRLEANGSVDTGFDVGIGFDDFVDAIAPAADGSGAVYVGGAFNGYDGTDVAGIVRITADGTRDAGFAVVVGFNGDVRAIAPALDGSGDVYVGGHFTSYDGTGSKRIIRLSADGAVDVGFAVGSGFDNAVFAIGLATDGSSDVYVGGGFTSYDTTPVGRAAALNPDGTLE
jgi:hypothetical protein